MKNYFTILILTLCFTAASHCGIAQTEATKHVALSGEVVGACNEIIVLAYPQDRSLDYIYPKFENGKFLFEYDITGDFIDIIVGLDGEAYGVRLNAGDTSRVLFTSKGDGAFDVDYFGRNEVQGRLWTDFYNTYGYWGQYNIRADKDTTISIAQALALLSQKDSTFRAEHASEMDPYHIHRADLSLQFLKMVLIEDSAYTYHKSTDDFAEYVAMTASIDPNDPMSNACGLLGRWFYKELPDMGSTELEQCLNFAEQKLDQIIPKSSKEFIATLVCNNVLRQKETTSEEKFEQSLDKLEALLSDYPEQVAQCRKSYEDYKRAKNLVDLPEATLETVDGKEVKLSDFYGKVLYIDFWATWCGPCVKETPHMEKLAERYKDNDKILFISISTDDNAEAWRKKITNDKPFWPQYRIFGKSGNDFMSATNMRFIPRFMIVLPNGKIFNLDAPRPSNVEAVTAEIEKALQFGKRY